MGSKENLLSEDTQEGNFKISMPEGGGHGSSERNLTLSISLGDDNNIVIVEESADPHSITTILNVCKRKLLVPYMRFLSLVGLKPILGQYSESRFIIKCLNIAYILQVLSFLLVGYFLQYSSCFRRDRGFGSISSTHAPTKSEIKNVYEENCNGSLIYTFIFPGVLHFAGYIYALIVFRRSDDDQLPVLIERVFLASSDVPNMQTNQRNIVKTLWSFVIGSFIWMLASFALVNYMMAGSDISFKLIDGIPRSAQIAIKILFIVCIIWHDITQASVVSNYCLQAQLLKKYIQFIREKLLQQAIKPLDWIRDIEEFRKLVTYLNEEVAPPVCVFTLLNWTNAISGTLWLMAAPKYDSVPLYVVANILNVGLWWFIAFVPFVQAARLTLSCENVKTVGQEVRTRPFAHQDTPVQELNSLLVYTSSLNISAKLFNLPINGKYAGVALAIVAIYCLVVGQTTYMSSV